ncbi:hypothetical protein V5O48_019685, partial [Marasmius crinis-equi]
SGSGSGSGGSGSSNGSRSASASPMSTTSVPLNDGSSHHPVSHHRVPNESDNHGNHIRHQQHQHHQQVHQHERHSSLDSLDIFSPAPGNNFDPWFQTFMTISNDKDQDATPVPPASSLNWTASNTQAEPTQMNGNGAHENNFQPQPAQFDPNSFNDLDYTVDPAG